MAKIEPKWLTLKDLDETKINPSVAPVYNVILQFGYDAATPEIKPLFQTGNHPSWMQILGWDEECDDAFWLMMFKVYKKNKDKLKDWGGNWENLKHYSRSPPGFDYILNSTPTNNKENWMKENNIN